MQMPAQKNRDSVPLSDQTESSSESKSVWESGRNQMHMACNNISRTNANSRG